MEEALSIRSLRKAYGQTAAVRDLSLSVRRGDLYGLLGPNGCGKTTTLRCALGLLAPDSGEVEVLGRPASRIHETAGRVAVVFDDAHLVPRLTVRQNLRYARTLLGHDGGRDEEEVIRLVGLEHRATHRSHELSLGQQRRLSIARSLLGRPELLILDEPLSGLDALGVTSMLDLFRTLRDEGITLVLSSHRLHEMQSVVQRVGFLLGGRIVREGALTELLGEHDGALTVEVTEAEPACAVAREAGDDVEELAPTPDGHARLRVRPADGSAAGLNARLVGAGVDVHALTPDRTTLPALFEALVRDDASRSDAAEGAP